ncbi:MAG: TonB-dependent receptor [Bacteroidetes bacterium]|nr:MAG: TonB-dependent receptor [Bacteroidota bacterium]
MKSLFLLVVTIAAFCLQGAGQDIPDDYSVSSEDTITVKNLQEVVVSVPRTAISLRKTPAAASIVPKTELNLMPRSIAADEALLTVPGVRVENQLDGSKVHLSIRGQGILTERGIRGVKVLLDGVSLNDPSGFVPDLYDVDWETVDRIEVLRGPAAAIYGGGSNAGILNIITQRGNPTPIGGRLYATAGSNGFLKVLGQVDGEQKNFNYRVSYSHIRGDGYRQHSAFRGNNLYLKGIWTPSTKVTITPVINYTYYFTQNPEGLNLSQLDDPKQCNPDAIPCNEYQKTVRLTNGLVGSINLGQHQQIRFSGLLRMGTYKETGSTAVTYRDIAAPGGSLQYTLNLSKNWFANHLSVGGDVQWQTIGEYKVGNRKDTTRTETRGSVNMDVIEDSVMLANQRICQQGIGVFLIDRMEFGKKLNLLLSLRYDNIDNELTDKMNRASKLSGKANFDKLTGRVGISYTFLPAINVYANWGQGFLPPSTEELINNPISYGGFNQQLVPATSGGAEIGLRGTIWQRFYYELTGFYLKTMNDFYRYRVPSRPLETFYGNAGASNRLGIESYVSYTPWDPLNVQVAYTFNHFTYTSPDSISGNWLPNCPEHQLYAQVQWDFLKHFSVMASTQWTSRWYIYTDVVHKDVFQKGYNLYNLRLAYHWKVGILKGEVSVYGKNLFNEPYIAFTEPDPDGNSYQPGPGREVFVTLKLGLY